MGRSNERSKPMVSIEPISVIKHVVQLLDDWQSYTELEESFKKHYVGYREDGFKLVPHELYTRPCRAVLDHSDLHACGYGKMTDDDEHHCDDVIWLH